MDRIPRAVAVLALAVGLAAAGPTAGIGLDPVDGEGTPVDGVDAQAPGTNADRADGGPASRTDAPPDRTNVERPATGGDVGAVGDGAYRPAVAANRTPNRLAVGPGSTRSGIDRPTPEMGASLSADYGEFGGIYLAYLARERLAATETDEERREVIRELLNRTEDRVEALRDREATTIRAYHNGSIDRRELLRRLASVHAEAGALRASLDDLQEGNALIPTQYDPVITFLISDLRSMEGPVREKATRAIRGEVSPDRIHVEASETGLVMEMIDEELYIREAIRMDHYAPDEPPNDIYSGIFERLNELYPRTIAAENATFDLDSVGSRLFDITMSHSTGELTLYLDRTTAEAYRETQRLSLDRIPTTKVTSATGDELLLTVNRTDDGNPYRVSVVDVSTGDPVDATVSLGDREVGRTGADGVLWALGPRGEFDVSAATGSERLNVTVTG